MPAWHQKLQSAKRIFPKEFNMGIKNAELDADSKSDEKVVKKL
jgi:hypothetical protein